MAFSTDKLFRGTESPVYLILGLLLGAMGIVNLSDSYAGDDFSAWANVAGAVSMLSFFVGARASQRWLGWVGVASFAVFAVLAVVDLFGLAS